MDKLKVGFIGCGQIFDLNILGYLDSEDVEITCLCDKKKKNAEEKINLHKLSSGVKIYTDYKEMLNTEEIDILEILLPHNLHCEVTTYAARKILKGISVQKPMATTVSECDKMIQACEENNVKLKIFENFCFYPPIARAKELIEMGIIGEPTSIRIKTAIAGKGGWDVPKSARKWRYNAESCGGGLECGSPIVFDDGYHKFWIALFLFDEKVEEVFAWIDRVRDLDVPAYIMWKYKPPEGSKFIMPHYGNIEFTLSPEMNMPSNYYACDEFIEIVGSQALMWINQATAGGNEMSESELFPAIAIYRDGEVKTISDLPRDWKYGFINSTKHFIDVIKNGGTPLLTGEQGKYCTQFALAALKSSLSGEKVSPSDLET